MIVDASAVVPRLITTEFTQASILLGTPAILRAPAFIKVEVAQVLWRYQRIGRIDARDVLDSMAALVSAIDLFTPDEVLLNPAIRVAIDLNHSVYDCLYLALALETGDTLATADKRLAAVARSLAIETHLIEAAS